MWIEMNFKCKTRFEWFNISNTFAFANRIVRIVFVWNFPGRLFIHIWFRHTLWPIRYELIDEAIITRWAHHLTCPIQQCGRLEAVYSGLFKENILLKKIKKIKKFTLIINLYFFLILFCLWPYQNKAATPFLFLSTVSFCLNCSRWWATMTLHICINLYLPLWATAFV